METTTRLVVALLEIGAMTRFESKATVTAGTTLRSRRSSPRISSANLYSTCFHAVASAPPMFNFTSAVAIGFWNGMFLSIPACDQSNVKFSRLFTSQ